jgi:hypothetical protein
LGKVLGAGKNEEKRKRERKEKEGWEEQSLGKDRRKTTVHICFIVSLV